MEYNEHSDEYAPSFHEGEFSLHRGDISEAVRNFNEYLSHGIDEDLRARAEKGLEEAGLEANQQRAMFEEGQSLMNGGDYFLATNLFQSCVDLGIDRGLVTKAKDRLQKTTFHAGNALMDREEYGEAIKMFQKSVNLGYGADLRERASEKMQESDLYDRDLYFLEEECDAAMRSGDEVRISEARSSLISYFNASEEFFLSEEKRKKDEALLETGYSEVDLVDRAKSRFYEARGISAAIDGELDESLMNYLKAVKHNPGNIGARKMLVAVYKDMGEHSTSFAHEKEVAIREYEGRMVGLGFESDLAVRVADFNPALATT